MSSKSDRDNRSNQLNPNNDAYHSSRGSSRGDDDDFVPTRRSNFSTYYAQAFRNPNVSSQRTEKFGFGAVSLQGTSVFRTAILEAPGSSLSQDAARVQLERFLETFERIAHRVLARSLGVEQLAIFAVFDPTESCLPWHVPFLSHDLPATREAISAERMSHLADRLRSVAPPDQGHLAMFEAISRGSRKRAEEEYRKIAADKLDPVLFIEALKSAVIEDAESWGHFKVPHEGHIGNTLEQELLGRLRI